VIEQRRSPASVSVLFCSFFFFFLPAHMKLAAAAKLSQCKLVASLFHSTQFNTNTLIAMMDVNLLSQ
jgi:hypothetical protein